MKKLAFSLLVALGFAAPTTALAATMQPAQAVQTEKAQGIWIDVRSAEEFAKGHFEEAVHVPHDQIEKRIAELVPSKDAPINLYCKSGRRAGIALETLKGLGYTNVTNHGGYKDLLAKGLK